MQYIFHLSDLHIRNGDYNHSRYEIYKLVFKNTIKSLKEKTEYLHSQEFIIIITGDIFHNKNTIGNHGLLLYKDFIQDLTKIGRVIIIHGNHDRNQNELDQPSLVQSSTFEIDNLTILKGTTSFIIDDIGFSYVSVDDTLDSYKTCGRVIDLPPFPHIDTEIKIALFHGTFAHAKMFNGEEIPEDDSYPLEWIKEFDYAILGDIHKRQYHKYNNKTLYGYSGSLIQQNYGEDIIEHGYLIWDIRNGNIKEIDVYNDIGYVNLKEEDGIVLIRVNSKFIPLKDYVKTPNFPKNIEIKLFSSIDFNNLNDILSENGISFNIISKNKNKETSLVQQTNNLTTDVSITDNNIIIKYFKKYLTDDNFYLFTKIINNKEHLLFDQSKYPEELHEECIRKNKELTSLIANCTKSEDLKKTKHTYKIKYLEWSNLYCYQGVNWIDMTDLDTKTFLVKGKNGTGKSAIYDIITLAIWGDITTLKQNTLSAGVINHNNNDAYTIIDIEIDNEIYRIERKFLRKTKNTINNTKKTLYKSSIIFKKDNACKDEIIKLVGTLDNFLSSSMLTQNVDYDILKMNYKDCVEFIDKSCNIEYLYNVYNLFKTAINKYKDIRKIIESKKQVYENVIKNTLNYTDNDVEEYERNLNNLIEKKELLQKEYGTIAIDTNTEESIRILNTSYSSVKTTITDEEYSTYKELYNECKYILKDEKDLASLKDAYDPSIKIKKIDKPCNMSYIKDEEEHIKNFAIPPDAVLNGNKTLEEMEILLKEYYKEYKDIDLNLKELINNKPEKPNSTSAKISISQYIKYNADIKELQNYIKNNNRITNNIEVDEYDITYDMYLEIKKKEREVKQLLEEQRKQLTELDERLNKYNYKKSYFTLDDKPLGVFDICELKTADDICNEIERLNIHSITEQMKKDDKILEEYYKKIKDYEDLEVLLENKENELYIFENNSDYSYDPNCYHCCNKKWVKHIVELKKDIERIRYNIEEHDIYNDNNYSYYEIILRQKENNAICDRYNILDELYGYYIKKEKYDTIVKNINIVQKKKNTLNNEINKNNLLLKEYENKYILFNAIAYKLYDTYVIICYNTWKEQYDNANEKYIDLKNKIDELNSGINYYRNVKPRIDKLNEIKEAYSKWSEYDKNYKIMKAYELYCYKEHIESYENTKEYAIKPLIERKQQLQKEIRDLEEEIKTINDTIVKHKTVNIYNNTNKNNHERLIDSIAYLDNIISILDIIIANFQAFRIETYDKYVLNNIVTTANGIVKSLCHKDTKPFKLDYMINTFKDSIHINWLINNDNSNNNIISVHQSSGFQHFVISLALRMALFLNNSDIRCDQLFIDEGFINFDKDNLSIVPEFIKSLLKYFNSIFIVSHIDLIQDNVDDMVEIAYNASNNNSSIRYGNK